MKTSIRTRISAWATLLMTAFGYASSYTVAYAQQSQIYPTRPIRIIVPLSPGTASDHFTRRLGDGLSRIYKQQVVVDNRPGAGGLIASTLLARATPDGYTLAMLGNPHIAAALLQTSPPYRALDDIAPIATVAVIPNVLVVSSAIPGKSVQDFVSYALTRPGKLNFASAGVGTSAHLAGEIFNRAVGIQSQHIPYKIMSDVFSDAVGGQLHYFVFTLPAAMPMLRDGKLRALAVTSSKRSFILRDVPTMAESGYPNAESTAWIGLAAPAGTPPKVIEQLHRDVVVLSTTPDALKYYETQGAGVVADTTPQRFAQMMQTEHERYSRLIRELGLKTQ